MGGMAGAADAFADPLVDWVVCHLAGLAAVARSPATGSQEAAKQRNNGTLQLDTNTEV
jgi:hypothetical protein